MVCHRLRSWRRCTFASSTLIHLMRSQFIRTFNITFARLHLIASVSNLFSMYAGTLAGCLHREPEIPNMKYAEYLIPTTFEGKRFGNTIALINRWRRVRFGVDCNRIRYGVSNPSLILVTKHHVNHTDISLAGPDFVHVTSAHWPIVPDIFSESVAGGCRYLLLKLYRQAVRTSVYFTSRLYIVACHPLTVSLSSIKSFRKKNCEKKQTHF